MALFKISKGLKANLPLTKTAGYCWYTTDDSLFYIDYEDENGELLRKALNAKDAETIMGASLASILNNSEVEIPTSQAVLNQLENYAQIDNVVSYANIQNTTDEQQAVARINISAAKSTIVQISDTEPTDEATEIWINTAEDWEDNAAAKVHGRDFSDITISDPDAVKEALDIDEGIVLENLTAAMPSSLKWYDIAYGDGVYIAIAYNSNVAARSYDGITWETINMPISAQWSTIAQMLVLLGQRVQALNIHAML